MKKEKLTPKQEELLKKEAEKNKLSEKEIEEIKDLVNTTGGMSEAMKRTLIGVGSALGASALTALGIFGFEKFRDRSKEKKDEMYLTPEEARLFSEDPEAMKQFAERNDLTKSK